jgi:hypothetical protein
MLLFPELATRARFQNAFEYACPIMGIVRLIVVQIKANFHSSIFDPVPGTSSDDSFSTTTEKKKIYERENMHLHYTQLICQQAGILCDLLLSILPERHA